MVLPLTAAAGLGTAMLQQLADAAAAAPKAAASRPAAATAAAMAKANPKAFAAAQDFESVFINTMFQQMSTDIGGEGPFGNSPGVGIWRSFLTNEYAKSFAKAGGIGLAAPVYRELLAHQSAANAPAKIPTPTVPTGAAP